MTTEEFLLAEVSKCSCGNTVKPEIEVSYDMNARLDHPVLKCSLKQMILQD